jgi:protein TonB
MREDVRRAAAPGETESLEDRVYRPSLAAGRGELRRADRRVSLPLALLGYTLLALLGWRVARHRLAAPAQSQRTVTLDLQDLGDGEAAPHPAAPPAPAPAAPSAPPPGALQQPGAPPLPPQLNPETAPEKPPTELPTQDLSRVAVPAAPATAPGGTGTGTGTATGGTGEGTGTGNGGPGGGHGPKVVEYDFSEVEVLFKPQITGADYPANARAARVQGVVKVDITVGTDGVPLSAHAQEGPPMLRKAAESLALKYRFKPETENGQPVIAHFSLSVTFRLS